MTQLAPSKQALVAAPGEKGIDPRGPRFGAGITAVLVLVALAVGLLDGFSLPSTVGGRVARPEFIIVAVVTALFAWGAFAGVQRHPYGRFFAAVIRPRLGAPTHLESPKPPTFAQTIGFVITVVALLLQVVGVPGGLLALTALAFVAAFLNSVFDYCFGCQVYVLLVRAGLTGRRTPA
ncbi:hypothetical protein AX769_16185 [Frondihabitans sp. PAMC 28766]|uniref:DUF4395 domain-containing protein n=1 Tax=Frondihabitans sp. PAMC 28766 TaxID=1795630 RepID=UPI00078D1B1C|nr:DUF4395 domain-containing protein [Frondihabitans sp. PAMC 28766]AMM21389.1 hypothetical protein AX769_16185 [Frondihabitans sp. PAMC 28766]